ncbi:MAG: M13 family metallopeptidase [Bacteroidales bacterium]
MTMSCKDNAKQECGFDVTNLDTTANPKDDFYQYACGGWMKKNPLSGEYARYGSFDQLAENNQKQLRDLIEGLAANTATEKGVALKIGTLYKVAMDSAKLNAQGAEPIQAELKSIQELKTTDEALSKFYDLQKQGMDVFFGYYVMGDQKNSSMNILNLYQGGTAMEDRDYYLSNDPNNKQIRAKYLEHLQKMFVLSGFDQATANAKANSVLAMETCIAKAQFSKVELRDPNRNYNKMSIAELQKKAPAFQWESYFKAILPVSIKEVNVSQVPFIVEMSKLISTSKIEDLKAYFEWSVINTAAPYLSDAFVAQNFDFFDKTMSGKTDMQARWKRAVNTANGVLSEAVGQMYVKKYFPPQAKERMLDLVGNIKKAMLEHFANIEWMTPQTKTKAAEKLNAIYVKVGYPDKWRDYTALNITDDSYWANILRADKFELDYMLAKIDKKVDKTEWLMSPQTVNAYYNPTTNEICFPAGILQMPFFYLNGDDAINYGAIGVVIAHEMTHGFDDQGRLYDKEGNLNNWWTSADADQFTQRTQMLVNHFNNIEVIAGLNANGQFTLGENIADNGGLQIAYTALQKALKGKKVKDIDGFTQDQRFFLSYANVWAGNIRDEEIRRLTKEDPHSLGQWRVNGSLPHIDAFLKAFDIKEGDKMYLAPEKRAHIW